MRTPLNRLIRDHASRIPVAAPSPGPAPEPVSAAAVLGDLCVLESRRSPDRPFRGVASAPTDSPAADLLVAGCLNGNAQPGRIEYRITYRTGAEA